MNKYKTEEIIQWNIVDFAEKIPLAESVLLEHGIEIDPDDISIVNDKLQEWARLRNRSAESLISELLKRIEELDNAIKSIDSFSSLQVIAGNDKSGNPELVDSLTLKPGDIIALVGPTGSGKSRLLADIEWLADGDTPSKRRILLDGKDASHRRTVTGGQRLVAQLSQTMSFVLDTTVEELLRLHAESRGCDNSVISATIEAANDLSGEQFNGSTPLTNLSGGQTRALMVADTAIVCKSPIVLIDELENAGIDRRKAFELLVSNEKIVLLSTHDPLLALLAKSRICMRNGAMTKLCSRRNEEREILSRLEEMDVTFGAIRDQIRQGHSLKLME